MYFFKNTNYYMNRYFEDGSVSNKSIIHDLANSVHGKGGIVPHEWFFINALYKTELLRNKELSEKLFIFICQFYPKYRYGFFDINDLYATLMIEASLHEFQFRKKYEFLENIPDNIFAQSMLFGDIATNFLIRYSGYSLIKTSGQNIIITAQSDCDKRFEEFFVDGYSVQLMAKIKYNEFAKVYQYENPYATGFFKKLPVIPTKETDYNPDEIIELIDGEYARILSPKGFAVGLKK